MVWNDPMHRSERRALEQRYHRLLNEHEAALWRLTAGYAFDRGEREDLLQEIFLALWKALPRFRDECTERTFLYRIAHNRGLSHSWRHRPAAADLREAEALSDPRPDPEAEVWEAQRRERLAAAVRALPVLLRQAVTLSLEGFTHQEIAEVLGITENNVGVRLNRARNALRAALDGEGGSP
jgi:RNA polymerase sigma-70 factor (ECF subfamily)